MKYCINEGDYTLTDQATRNQEELSLLEEVFVDGKLVKEQSLAEIRERLLNS